MCSEISQVSVGKNRTVEKRDTNSGQERENYGRVPSQKKKKGLETVCVKITHFQWIAESEFWVIFTHNPGAH